MKKIVCLILAVLMIAATATVLSGCGDDKSKSSSATEATKAPTVAPTQAPTVMPTAQLSTLSGQPLETLAPQVEETAAPVEEQTEEQQNSGDNGSDYYGTYGGLTGQNAILAALNYAGEGYQCVSYEQRYLQNSEAWYIGIQAADGSDPTVYYLYVNANDCVPTGDIPSISGGNGEGNGNYAGIPEQEAIIKALGMRDEVCTCVSSEQSGVGGTEYWRIGIQSNDDPDGEIYYYLVSSDSCIPE